MGCRAAHSCADAEDTHSNALPTRRRYAGCANVSGPSPGWRYTTGLRPPVLAQPMRSLAAGCPHAGPDREVPSTSWYVSRNAPAGASARSNGMTSEENNGQQYSSSLSSKSSTPAHTG